MRPGGPSSAREVMMRRRSILSRNLRRRESDPGGQYTRAVDATAQSPVTVSGAAEVAVEVVVDVVVATVAHREAAEVASAPGEIQVAVEDREGDLEAAAEAQVVIEVDSGAVAEAVEVTVVDAVDVVAAAALVAEAEEDGVVVATKGCESTYIRTQAPLQHFIKQHHIVIK